MGAPAKIVIAGGSGFLGRYLRWALSSAGYEVLALSRQGEGARRIRWDGNSLPPGCLAALEGAAAWINLCGAGIAEGRWSAARKKLLTESRILPTKALVETIPKLKAPPRAFLSASAVGFYGDRGSAAVDESHVSGSGFLAQLCQDWEKEAMKASAFGVRTVLLRTGAVLARDGGILSRMVPAFKLFLGGPLGDGKQWLSWISRDDWAGLVGHVIAGDLSGPVNLTAPVPVTNKDFSEALGQALRRPSWLRAPSWALSLGLGEMADMLLTGQRVTPKKAMDSGYSFKHPDLDSALRDEL